MCELSILLPSRKRVDSFEKSINSLINNSSKSNNFEILIALDNDDMENNLLKTNIISNIQNKYTFISFQVVLFERQGYTNLHVYYNKLANISKGKVLWLWNDDCVVETLNWDVFFIINHYNNKNPLHFYNPVGAGVWFPAISKETYNIIGHFSKSPHNDTYIEYIATELNMLHTIEEVYVNHNNIYDDVFDEGKIVKLTSSLKFFTNDIIFVKETVLLLIKYLKSINNNEFNNYTFDNLDIKVNQLIDKINS